MAVQPILGGKTHAVQSQPPIARLPFAPPSLDKALLHDRMLPGAYMAIFPAGGLGVWRLEVILGKNAPVRPRSYWENRKLEFSEAAIVWNQPGGCVIVFPWAILGAAPIIRAAAFLPPARSARCNERKLT